MDELDGKFLKEILAVFKMRRIQFASEAGVRDRTVQNWMARLTDGAMEAIEEVFGIPVQIQKIAAVKGLKAIPKHYLDVEKWKSERESKVLRDAEESGKLSDPTNMLPDDIAEALARLSAITGKRPFQTLSDLVIGLDRNPSILSQIIPDVKPSMRISPPPSGHQFTEAAKKKPKR